jgi:Arc/MetJ family transcription regulator
MPRVKRTSMNLDFELVEQARAELGTNGTTDTVHRALGEVVRRAKLDRMLEVMDDIFGRPPPDGYDDWNDWIEAQEDEVP